MEVVQQLGQNNLVERRRFPPRKLVRRGARVDDWARLEIVCAPNPGTEGSNPSLSAVSGDS